ncbi:hypothetical protein OAB02_04050 [Candidatus Pelagibacter sp.]|nr:hypothetical protein [Candidatus Pelagibacter sp.]
MKQKINILLSFIGHFLIYFSCYIESPSLCAYLIRVSILKNKFSKKKISNKKIAIVLDRSIGHRDVEIIQETSKKAPEFMFLRRSITKIILYYFSEKKNFFFNYHHPPVSEKDYFNQNKINRKKHEQFWEEIILSLKNYYSGKILNFVTFNYTYFAEAGLYAGCKKNDVPVKLWYKESIKTQLEADLQIKNSGTKFNQVFANIQNISVYNELVKKMFVKIDKKNKKKITVNGCPRIYDYVIKRRYSKRIRNILFLSFDSKRGIPQYKKNVNLNWNLTYDKVIKILNEISADKKLNIVIKRKNKSTYKTSRRVNKRIKIFENGTAQKFINQADIVIGHNSASTIEALINGKYVMVPFFEKKMMLKKYLYNFNKELIYTSEKNMKKSILNLVNKKVSFPLNNKKHQKTIQYYFGSYKNITQKYINFLNR